MSEKEITDHEYEESILKLLKNALIDINVKRMFQSDKSNKRKWYLRRLNDNLYRPMDSATYERYEEGSGNEVHSGKMNALRSSSALTYNLFWNRIAKIKKHENTTDQIKELGRIREGLYTVELEKQYPTLTSSRKPANLDAFLYQKDTCEAIAIEMKMLEWVLDKPSKLSQSYLCKNNYFDPDVTSGAFIQAANSLIDHSIPLHKDGYSCRLEKYDAFQMFRHTVACYRACFDKTKEERKIDKLTLVNCIWTFPESAKIDEDIWNRHCYDFDIIKSKFGEFKDKMQPVINLFKEGKVDFNIVLCEFKDFLALLEKDKEELDYLRRYTFKDLDLTDK